jgi:toxin ParE1/3/4
MAVYKLSSKADADLAGIYEYTILNFGSEQGRAYLLGLHEYFAALSDHPMQGSSAHEFAPNLRRFEYQSLRVRFPVACHEGNLGQGVRYPAACCGVIHSHIVF